MKYIIDLTYQQGDVMDVFENNSLEYTNRLKWAKDEGIEVDNHGNILLQVSTEVMQYLIEFNFPDDSPQSTMESFIHNDKDEDWYQNMDYYIDDDGCIIY